MRASLLALLVLAAPAFAQGDDYFSRVDLDSDGRVSLEEFLERMAFAFRQMDEDGNGVLEPHEQHVPDAPRITLEEHEARFGAQFRRQDANNDGYLSRQELMAPPRR
jgi:Ca2+-binding EF-hand superfamily protein